MGWVQILLGFYLHFSGGTLTSPHVRALLSESAGKAYEKLVLHLNPAFLLPATVTFGEFIHLSEPYFCKMQIIKSSSHN